MLLAAELFLNKLHRGLKWRVPLNEAEDIVKDYREFFGEEQKRGKTEAQIIEALGSPRQVIKTILAERKPTLRHEFYNPCLVIAVIAAVIIPVFALKGHGLVYAFTTNTLSDYVFVLLAPFPALLLYCLYPANGRVIKRERMFLATSGLALLLFCISSLLMYLFLKELFEPRINLEPMPMIWFVYYPLVFTSLVACFAWVLGIFRTEKLGRYTPSLYFICAVIQFAALHYISILAEMDLSDNSISFENFVGRTFYHVLELFAFSAVGIVLWCGFQYMLRKRGVK